MYYDKRTFDEVLDMPTGIRKEYMKFVAREKASSGTNAPNNPSGDISKMSPKELEELAISMVPSEAGTL